MERVRIVSTTKGGTYKHCVGKFGTIVPGYGSNHTNIAVEVDDMYNYSSQRGYFWFTSSELEYLEAFEDEAAIHIRLVGPKNNKKEESEEKVVSKDVCAIVRGQYLGGNLTVFNFGVIKGSDLCNLPAVGALVAVSSTTKGYSLIKVYEVITETGVVAETIPHGVFISTVDVKWYEDYKEQQKRKQELEIKMKERAAQLQNIQLYESLAAFDPNMAELVKEFKGLV